jgi:hypothetical protein
MRFRMIVMALTLLSVGCGNDTSAPGGAVLVGQWGVAGEAPARLVGLRVAAELQFACSSVGVNEPVELGHDGRFAFEGRLHTSGLTSASQTAQVSGQVVGERVSLTMNVLGDGVPAQSLTLHAGVDPAFEQLPPTCPL